MIRLFLFCIAFTVTINVVAQTTNEALAKDVFNAVNEFRKSKKLAPLIWSAPISSVATKHSSNMATKKVPFSHQGFTTRSKALVKFFPNKNSTSENLIFNVNTGEQALNEWKTSAGHNKNMLGQFTHTGVGVAKDAKGYFYITQIFIQ